VKALAIVAVLGSAAHADTLFATENGGKLFVNQLAGNVMTSVYDEPSAAVFEYAFADTKTLWVLRAKQGRFSVGTIADGKAGPERVLTYKDWDGNTKGPGWPPHLVITKTHQVWVTRCVELKNAESDDISEGLVASDRSMCTNVYRRVDADAPLATTLSDVEIVAANWQRRWPQSKTAPKGYTVSTDSGFACKGPHTKMTIQLGTRWARDDGFVSDAPVIVRFSVGTVRGKPMPYMGHEDRYAATDIANDDGTGTYFVEDCKTHLRAVIAIEPGVIATSEGEKTWRLRRGDKDLATFTSTRVVAPAPSP
jgi:hypothetical protein